MGEPITITMFYCKLEQVGFLVLLQIYFLLVSIQGLHRALGRWYKVRKTFQLGMITMVVGNSWVFYILNFIPHYPTKDIGGV